jgi:hypothetical protein
MKKQHIQLTQADREYLEILICTGQQTAKAYRRALGLLELDRGQTTYTCCCENIAGLPSNTLHMGTHVLGLFESILS